MKRRREEGREVERVEEDWRRRRGGQISWRRRRLKSLWQLKRFTTPPFERVRNDANDTFRSLVPQLPHTRLPTFVHSSSSFPPKSKSLCQSPGASWADGQSQTLKRPMISRISHSVSALASPGFRRPGLEQNRLPVPSLTLRFRPLTAPARCREFSVLPGER